MRNREDAVRFTAIQLDNKSSVHDECGEKPNGTHHYGKMEIQELLDYIYEVNSKGETIETEIKIKVKQREKA
jgi:hypothetical protein